MHHMPEKTPEKPMTLAERKAKEREERTKLIRKAGKGDKKALKVLSGPPYHMKVFTPEEREEYMKQQAEQS
jgi:hypothetical protein|tara:strand:- start:483 stop:695 length:213 start_codon:yes stop_codon:yes gene_type:complete